MEKNKQQQQKTKKHTNKQTRQTNCSPTECLNLIPLKIIIYVALILNLLCKYRNQTCFFLCINIRWVPRELLMHGKTCSIAIIAKK